MREPTITKEINSDRKAWLEARRRGQGLMRKQIISGACSVGMHEACVEWNNASCECDCHDYGECEDEVLPEHELPTFESTGIRRSDGRPRD